MVAGSSPAGPTIFKHTLEMLVEDLKRLDGCLVKPHREPDFVLGLWEFFFAEMVQVQTSEQIVYRIRENRSGGQLLWFNERICGWCTYEQGENESEVVWSAYVDWQVYNILLR